MKKKTWIIIIIAAVLAVLAMAAAIILDVTGRKTAETKPRLHSLNAFYSDTEAATRFISDAALLDDRVAGAADRFITCDGTVGAALAGTGLYRVDANGVKMIHPAGVDRFALSLDGRLLVYTTATELHIYDERTGSVTDVKPDDIYGVASIAISPSGDTVGYSVKAKDGSFYAYSYKDGKSSLLMKDAYIMAIADGAEFYYYIEPDGVGLFYAEGRNTKKLGTDVAGLVEFNRDLTEALFDMNGATFVSVKGGAARELIKGYSVYCASALCESEQGGESCVASVKDRSTLFDGIFYAVRTSDGAARDAYDVWYVDGKLRAQALVKGTDQFFVTEDGGSLSCIVDRTLYSMDVKNPDNRSRVASNVWSFGMTRDGGEYYCVGYDSALYYVKKGAVPVKRAENAVYCTVTREGRCLSLASYDGSVGRLISFEGGGDITDIAGGVYRVEAMPGMAYYLTGAYKDEYGNYVRDVYTSSDGTAFAKAVEAVPADAEDAGD